MTLFLLTLFVLAFVSLVLLARIAAFFFGCFLTTEWFATGADAFDPLDFVLAVLAFLAWGGGGITEVGCKFLAPLFLFPNNSG